MVAATQPARVLKRFYSGSFAPPPGLDPAARGPEVTAAEILAGGVRESDWSFPVLVTTENQDRQGDVVIAAGCDYAAFALSPIAFFDHQEIKFPVGSMRGPDGRLYFCIIPGVGILGRIWIRQPQPDDPPAYAEACKTVWILVRDGLLNGISAGFDPLGPVKELPSGGCLYKRFELLEVSIVPVAANRECRVLREPFAPADWDAAVLKRFTPSVIKGLRSMSTTTATGLAARRTKSHDNTHDIKFRDGSWVILDNSTRKPLSHHKTRSEAVAAMRALQVHKAKRPAKSKGAGGMSESSGTSGGYVVPEEHKATYKAITERMADHGDDAKGHEVYFHPGTGEVRHVHPEGAGEEQVKAIGADLSDAPGVKGVMSSSERPKDEDGYHKMYACKDMADGDGGGDGGDGGMQEESHAASVHKHGRRTARRMARVGKAIFGMVRKRKVNGWIGKSLERAARGVMPTLLAAEVDEGKAIEIAWGIASVRKGLLPLVAKAMDDGDDDEDDAGADTDDDATAGADDDAGATTDTTADADTDAAGTSDDTAEDAADDTAEDAADDAATDAALDNETEGGQGPEGLELVQAAIENLEAALPRLEPERREFWAGIIDQIKAHGEETYPDEDFGGEDDAGEEGAAAGGEDDATEQKVTDEMLARYKGLRPKRVKRISARRVLKSLRRDPEMVDAVRKAANHLHEIGDMGIETDEKGCQLKGYTPAHHRACRLRARELDRLHGALTKGEEPARGGDDKPADGGAASGAGGAGGDAAQHGDDGFDLGELMPRFKSLAEKVDPLVKAADELQLRATGRRRY